MRWEPELFAFLEDLESQAESQYDAERAAELVDRGHAEYAEVTLAARVMASLDREVALEVEGVGVVRGRLERVGRGWILVRGESQDWLVPMPAVVSVAGASERAVPEVAWPAIGRLGVRSPLRRLADAGAECVVHQRDQRQHSALIRRVGADFVEVVVGDPARELLIPLDRVAAVSSRH